MGVIDKNYYESYYNQWRIRLKEDDNKNEAFALTERIKVRIRFSLNQVIDKVEILGRRTERLNEVSAESI